MNIVFTFSDNIRIVLPMLHVASRVYMEKKLKPKTLWAQLSSYLLEYICILLADELIQPRLLCSVVQWGKNYCLGLSLCEKSTHTAWTFGCNSVLKIEGTFPEVSFIVNGGWGAGFPGDLIRTLELGFCQSWPGQLSTDQIGSLGIILSLLFCYESINQICFEVRHFALSFCVHLQMLLTIAKRLIYLSFKEKFLWCLTWRLPEAQKSTGLVKFSVAVSPYSVLISYVGILLL